MDKIWFWKKVIVLTSEIMNICGLYRHENSDNRIIKWFNDTYNDIGNLDKATITFVKIYQLLILHYYFFMISYVLYFILYSSFPTDFHFGIIDTEYTVHIIPMYEYVTLLMKWKLEREKNIEIQILPLQHFKKILFQWYSSILLIIHWF